ncbi:hypothetical protein B0H13DRAFT_1880538 [Mycena leptocephala]|nr:hypothetical protein B0H13DRAFT_1880538 [Mycena leptocephala]
MMLAPNAELRKLQKQERLDWLQALRGEVSKPTPAKLPAQSLPFPTSPPSATPLPEDTLGRDAEHSTTTEPAIFDCQRCQREIYPITRCACGTPKKWHAAWKITSDQSYKDDPKGWFELNAPPQQFSPTANQIWAEYDRELAKLAPELEAAERKAKTEAARAQSRAAAAEAASIGLERVACAEKKTLQHATQMAMRSPMIAVVMELERRVYVEMEKIRGPARAAAEAERVAAQQVVEERVRLIVGQAAQKAAASCTQSRGMRVLSPPGQGFRYWQEGWGIWLAPDNGGAAGSMMYVGDADGCVVPGPGHLASE